MSVAMCRNLSVILCKLNSIKQENCGKTFFSVVGNSSEVILKASRNGSVGVTLDFDVLSFSSSRIGFLNDSEVELTSLSKLEWVCRKLDPYGLNNETQEIADIDTKKERLITTKTVLIKNKLRVQINVSIPVISDHSFGDYNCLILCVLQRKSYLTNACRQTKYFSIVFDNWRKENIENRKPYYDCPNMLTNLEKEQNELSKTVDNLIKSCKDL